MSEEQKQDLEGRGFIVTQKIHLYIMTVITVLLFLGGLFVAYAVAYNEKETLKSNVEKHETRINNIENSLPEIRDNQLEIKLNLKTFMEQYNIKYQEINTNK